MTAKPRTIMQPGGFTLLEMLLAVSVVAIVATLAYMMLSQVIELTETSRNKAAEMRVREFLSWNFRRNFTGAYLHPWEVGGDSGVEPYYYFEGLDEDGADGPQDTLTFFTTARLLGSRAMPGDIKQITIEVVGSDEDEDDISRTDENEESESEEDLRPKRILQVVETPATGADVSGSFDLTGSRSAQFEEDSSLVESPSWSIPIESFNVEYYYADASQKEWIDEWDSREFQRLPWAVRISINFPKPEAEREAERNAGIDLEEDPDYRVVIPILTAGMGTVKVPIEVQGLDPQTVQVEDGVVGAGAAGQQGQGRDSDQSGRDNDSQDTTNDEPAGSTNTATPDPNGNVEPDE